MRLYLKKKILTVITKKTEKMERDLKKVQAEINALVEKMWGLTRGSIAAYDWKQAATETLLHQRAEGRRDIQWDADVLVFSKDRKQRADMLDLPEKE